MGRKVDIELLVGTHEIASRLELGAYQRVHEFRRRYLDFPQPIAQLKQAMIWYWPEVERWARKKGRLPTSAGRK